MIARHPKRWCEQCHAMIFSRGHEHGQVVIELTQNQRNWALIAEADRSWHARLMASMMARVVSGCGSVSMATTFTALDSNVQAYK